MTRRLAPSIAPTVAPTDSEHCSIAERRIRDAFDAVKALQSAYQGFHADMLDADLYELSLIVDHIRSVGRQALGA